MQKKITVTVFTSTDNEIVPDLYLEEKFCEELEGFDWWGDVDRIKVNVETVVVSEEEIAEWD